MLRANDWSFQSRSRIWAVTPRELLLTEVTWSPVTATPCFHLPFVLISFQYCISHQLKQSAVLLYALLPLSSTAESLYGPQTPSARELVNFSDILFLNPNSNMGWLVAQPACSSNVIIFCGKVNVTNLLGSTNMCCVEVVMKDGSAPVISKFLLP